MTTLKIALLILLTTGVVAQNKWHTLKYVNDYPASAFHLKEGIEYLELRQYKVDENNKLKKKPYKTVLSLYKTPLKSLDQNKVKHFRKIKPNLSSQSNITKYDLENHGMGCHYLYNAFAINDQEKMFGMNMIKDVIGFLGEIDTPAEAQAVLWLHDKHSGKYYSKTSQGYEIIIEYENDISECKKFKYKATINKKGKIIKYNLLKSTKLKTDCIESISWTPCDDR